MHFSYKIQMEGGPKGSSFILWADSLWLCTNVLKIIKLDFLRKRC